MKINIKGKTYLVIDAIYDKSTYNWYSGQTQSCGIYIHFTPKTIESGWSSTTVGATGSFKVLFKELTRISKKQIKLANEYISQNKDLFYKLWINGKYQEIANMIIDNRNKLEVIND